MTATATAVAPDASRRRDRVAQRFRRNKEERPIGGGDSPPAGPVPPLSPRLQFARAALIMVFALSLTLLLQLVVIGAFQHSAAQERTFDQFRSELAIGTAPSGPTDSLDRELAIGTPVAFLEIPEIDVSEVVVYGTTPSALFSAPGIRRDTVLPGQIGASVVMGRHAAFGGPFSRLAELEEGDIVRVTTGQGEFEYEVLGVRREGDPVPPPPETGVGRLVLATADGRAFMPDGVLRVDAELAEGAVVGPAPLSTAATLPASEQFMGIDTSNLWVLVLWIQALIVLAVGAVWSWHRWGRPQTWIVFFPPLLLVGLAASAEVARLLPNLL